jgi:two-component system sensor histidine kinase KdpD
VVWGHLEAVAGVGLCTLLSLAALTTEHEASVASLYLAAIMVSTLRRGLWPGVLAAALSYLAMDYFFLPPLHGIDFDEPIDWLCLLVFLGTVGLINHLLQVARVDAAAARRREHVARQIAGVSQATGMADG